MGSCSQVREKTAVEGARDRARVLWGLLVSGVAVWALVLTVPAAAGAASLFGSQSTYAVGSAPQALAVGDFDGDGHPDLAVANYNSNTVSVLLGNGDGTFQPQTTYAVGGEPNGVAVGDFNGDGHPDLAVANYNSNTVSVLLGNGDGTFQPQTTYAVGPGPNDVKVGDFSGDGHLDLAVTDANSNQVSVLLGNGDGTFQPQATYPVGTLPNALVVGDFNGDGHLDLAVINSFGSGNLNATLDSMSVLFGKGDGTFQPQVIYPGTPDFLPYGIAAGDFNGDGHPDLAVTNFDEVNFGELWVLLNKGDGTFQPSRFASPCFTPTTGCYRVGTQPAGVAVGDFNGDGHQDLVDADSGDAAISVLLGRGDGTFGQRSTYPVGTAPDAVAVGDFNGDGQPDVAVANHTANTVSVLLNTTQRTSTRVLCSPASVVVGQSSSCTATVTDRGPAAPVTPTGSVQFASDSSGSFSGSSCTLAATSTTGVASCQVSYTPSAVGSGHHTITGTYGGDSVHRLSSGQAHVAVGLRSTRTSVSCMPGSVVVGQSSSCTATVTDRGAAPLVTPTGSVGFSSGSSSSFSPSNSCVLGATSTAGVASCSVSYVSSATGSGTINAAYGGDPAHARSSGSTVVHVGSRSTSTSVSCSPSSVDVGVATSCTATVSDTDVGSVSTPSGSVSFSSDSSGSFSPSSRSCSLAATPTAGVASCQVSYTPSAVMSGTHTITGSYGDDRVHARSSAQTTVGVGLRSTSTSVSCSPSSVDVGLATSCTATVSDTDSGAVTTPTGSAGFSSDSSGTFSPAGGSCSLSSTATTGVASCSVSYVPSAVGSGTHTITAGYGGDGTHATSSGHVGVSVAPTPAPSITVKATGTAADGACQDRAIPADHAAYVESYTADARTLYSDVLLCSNAGETAGTSFQAQSGCSNPDAESDLSGPCASATYPDGEGVQTTLTPDDDGMGLSNATQPPTLYQQGFSCGDTVGVGPSDNTARNIKNADSVEVYQPYADYDGNPVTSITTVCIGKLPSATTISSSIVTHLVNCYEYNPYNPSGAVAGLGISVTYPDDQYAESCNVPNYPTPTTNNAAAALWEPAGQPAIVPRASLSRPHSLTLSTTLLRLLSGHRRSNTGRRSSRALGR